MKIVFLSETASIHAARWINQLKNSKIEIYFIQGYYTFSNISSQIETGNIYTPHLCKTPARLIKYSMIPFESKFIYRFFQSLDPILKQKYARYVSRQINIIKPDIIHVLGLHINEHNMTEMLVNIWSEINSIKPIILYSSWGSDLDYYATQSSRNKKEVQKFLQICRYHIPECSRDIRLAKKFGFSGITLPIFPAAGGIELRIINRFKYKGKTSKRKIILIKGRDNRGIKPDPIGRANIAIQAIKALSKDLHGYQIYIFQASPSIEQQVGILKSVYKLNIHILPYGPYNRILRIMGRAKAFIGITSNDGLPLSLVESMALGAIPIYTHHESLNDWVENNVNAFLIKQNNVSDVINAIKIVLYNNKQIDKIASNNQLLVNRRLLQQSTRKKVISIYEDICKKLL